MAQSRNSAVQRLGHSTHWLGLVLHITAAHTAPFGTSCFMSDMDRPQLCIQKMRTPPSLAAKKCDQHYIVHHHKNADTALLCISKMRTTVWHTAQCWTHCTHQKCGLHPQKLGTALQKCGQCHVLQLYIMGRAYRKCEHHLWYLDKSAAALITHCTPEMRAAPQWNVQKMPVTLPLELINVNDSTTVCIKSSDRL